MIRLAILWITLATGEQGPVVMSDDDCAHIVRNFHIAISMGQRPVAELADGRHVEAKEMVCKPIEEPIS